MGRRHYVLSSVGFVADPESVALSTGRQVDWAKVAAVNGRKSIPAGTVMVQDASSKLVYPRKGAAEGVTAFGILVTSAHEDFTSDAKSGYGVYVGGVFYENLLPDHGGTDFATMKTELGNRYVWETYQDNRV